MKAIFCVDITETKLNDIADGDEFVVDKVSEAQELALDSCEDDFEELKKDVSLPWWLKVLKFVFEFGSLLAIFLVADIIGGEVSLPALLDKGMLYLLGCIVSVIGFISILIYERKHKKSVEESEDTAIKINHSNAAFQASYDMLGVPYDAKNADILSMRYKRKNGALCPKSNGLFTFINFDCKLFADDDNFYVADTLSKYAFPKGSLKGIRKIDKRIDFTSWNKDTAFNKGEYKQYKIKTNDYSTFFVKPYYALQLTHNDEDYELYFPPYELETVEQLTGVKFN